MISVTNTDYKDSIKLVSPSKQLNFGNSPSHLNNVEGHNLLHNDTYLTCEEEMNELYNTNSNESNKDNFLQLNSTEQSTKLKVSSGLLLHKQNKYTGISHQKGILSKKSKQFLTLNRGSPPFFCKLCATFYTNYASYRRHLRMHIDGRNHVCESCGMQFYRRYLLNQHRINVHAAYSQGGMWKCHLCDRWLKGSDKLKKHLEIVHCSSGQAKRSRRKIEYLLQTVASLVDRDNKESSDVKLPVNKGLSSDIISDDRNCSALNNLESNEKRYHVSSQKSVSSFRKPLIKKLNRRCFVCETCKKVFVYHTSYLQHRKMHTRNKPFMCQYCCLSFSSADTLAVHKKKHQPNPRYICYLCGYRTGNSSVLMAHFLEHNPASDKKDNQDCENKAKKEVSDESEVSQNAAYCKYCRKIFLNINNYDRHMRLHKSNFQWFSCTYCGKLSPSLIDHKKHIASHSSSSFSCPKCKAPFKTEDLMKHHILSCSRNGCLIKDKSTEEQSALCLPTRRSARLLNKQKAAAVILSSNKSDNEELKQQRTKLLSKEKQTLATVQPSDNTSVFFDKSKSQIQKFICNLCKHSFTNKDSFRRHKRMHSNKHRHSCEYCGKYFFRKDQCRYHETSVHSAEHKKVYCCFYCKVSFPEAAALKNHVSSHKTPPVSLGQSAFSTVIKDDYGNEYTTTRSVVKSEGMAFSHLHPSINYAESKLEKSVQVYQTKHLDCNIQNIQDKSTLKGNLFGHLHQAKRSTSLKFKQDSTKQNTHVLVIGQGEDKNKNISSSDKNKTVDSSQTYKCGRCSISFKDLQGILDHFQDVHGVVKIQQSSETVHQSSSQDHMKLDFQQNKNTTISKHMQSAETLAKYTDEGKPKIVEICTINEFEDSTIKPNESSERLNTVHSIKTATFTEVQSPTDEFRQGPYRRCSRCCKQFRSISSLINHICEKEVSVSISQQDDVSCNLCLKEFENKSVLATHEQLNHMLVEWYQCLVCSMSGPRNKMTQHMLSHMYKVGSFVVEGGENKFEYILPFLPGAAQKKTQRIKNATKQLQNDCFDSAMNQSCIPPEEFPMQDVFCKVCNRIFTCLTFLLRHKCITRIARGPFPCCIARCSSQLATKGDMIAHIKKFHYRPIQRGEVFDNSSLVSTDHVISGQEKLLNGVSESGISVTRFTLDKYTGRSTNDKNHKEIEDVMKGTICEGGSIQQGVENPHNLGSSNNLGYETQDYEEITVEPSLDIIADMMDYNDKEQEGLAKCGQNESFGGTKGSVSQVKPPAYSVFELNGQEMFKCEDCVQVFTNNISWLKHCQHHMDGNLQ